MLSRAHRQKRPQRRKSRGKQRRYGDMHDYPQKCVCESRVIVEGVASLFRICDINFVANRIRRTLATKCFFPD